MGFTCAEKRSRAKVRFFVRRGTVLVAQWVMNVLQFLTLIAVIWYTRETYRSGLLLSRQYDREWKPQYHFSIRGLDPTTGTGELSASLHKPADLIVDVVNMGRPALVVR